MSEDDEIDLLMRKLANNTIDHADDIIECGIILASFNAG